MSNEAVRRKILLVSGDLNVPLNYRLSRKKASSACEAAKFIRHRLLREHSRVTQNIEEICQAQWNDDDESCEALAAGAKGTSRDEFLFIADLMILEKMVLPLLLAHGLHHADSVLPQFLKLITAMLLPIPRFSQKETVQKDVLAKLKQRCSTDEIMSFLIQVVAPIAGKRKAGNIEREDVVLLEVVLNLLSLLLRGSNENIIGSFSRNHGVEMLLVVINQNFAKQVNESCSTEKAVSTSFDAPKISFQGRETLAHPELPQGNMKDEGKKIEPGTPSRAEREGEESPITHTEDVADAESDIDNDLVFTNLPEELEEKLAAEMQEKEHDLVLESENRLWIWNKLIMSCISSVLAASPGEELAQWCLLHQQSNGSADRISVQRNSQTLQACRKERERWRNIARSRSGPMASNSLFVRRDTKNNVSLYAVGTVSTLLGGGSQRKDSLEAIRIMDSRKRGRFIKGMFQDTKPKCSLPIETQLELSKQLLSFFLYGFEPLTAMVWNKLRKSEKNLGEASMEYQESRAGYKNFEEEIRITSPLNVELYESLNTLLDNMSIGGSFLRFMREFVSYHSKAPLSSSEANENRTIDNPITSPHSVAAPGTGIVAPTLSPLVHQLWQCLSVIISLDRFTHVFSVLQLYLTCKDVKRRTDIRIPICFATELLLALQILMDGKLRDDPVVKTAAHALVSTVLYHHEVIKTLFDLVGSMSSYMMPLHEARALTLFAYAVLKLVEACSFGGRLFVPNSKGKPKKSAHDSFKGIERNPTMQTKNEAEESVPAGVPYAEPEKDKELLDMLEASGVKASRRNQASKKDDDKKDDAPLSSSTVRSSSPSRREEEEERPDEERGRNEMDSEANLETLDRNTAAVTEVEDLVQVEKSNSPERNNEEMEEEHSFGENENRESEEDRDQDTVSEAPSSFSYSSGTSSGTATSIMESEREMTLYQLLQRLSSPKNIFSLLVTLRHWRTNDADVNLALVYLMEAMMKEGKCASAFFTLPFLLAMREVLVHGQTTHAPLYKICDELVFDFFNPAYAHRQDERFEMEVGWIADPLTAEKPPQLTGAQSFVGFEVALRCARSLFAMSAVDYTLLEEKGMAYLEDDNFIPLSGEQDEGASVIDPKTCFKLEHADSTTLQDDGESRSSSWTSRSSKRRSPSAPPSSSSSPSLQRDSSQREERTGQDFELVPETLAFDRIEKEELGSVSSVLPAKEKSPFSTSTLGTFIMSLSARADQEETEPPLKLARVELVSDP